MVAGAGIEPAGFIPTTGSGQETARQLTGTIAGLEDDRARVAYAWWWLREECGVEL
jgi:hypothetical protein